MILFVCLFVFSSDYVGSVDEEKKNAVRKLTREKDELQQENQSLKRKVQELQKLERGGRLSPRPSVCLMIYVISD